MADIDSNLFPTSIIKRIDNPWIGLLVLGIFILISSIIALIVLCFLWRRHQQRTQLYNENFILSNKPTGKRQIPIQIEDQQSKSYETQKMEVFVPSNDNERIHTRFTSPNDIQQVQQFYERTTKAYF
ncbi:unnamed protein product [Adineta steineri]|uniref:Uncharacterized protein n=1 Tax=Adineta steineri TaxID=433720 RepID=A0A814A2J7_9BILA|nr:unnamed protein product [Adineta steineri]CAF0941000.1 unnamed protein product [Adineta steineri]CAF1047915.1 unnamed protein product [Adineta steineri]